MYVIETISTFDEWLSTLTPDVLGRIIARLHKVENGLLGDSESVGEGVFELREHFGPGYRMYYVKNGKTVLLMLGGGDKASQKKDIASAKKLAMSLK